MAAEYEADDLRQVVAAMKHNPRGPFFRIRWFCKDGKVLPPKPHACQKHGGGHQHGQWSDATLRLHQAGFFLANVLAELGPDDFGKQVLEQAHFRMLLLERFLIAYDDGWIFRKARFYRGARQMEDEEAAARVILAASLGGIVQLSRGSKPLAHSEPAFTAGDTKPAVIKVNVDKLDLDRTLSIPVSQLRGSDSGVIVGPKAAQIGELSHYFPHQVSAGLAIPFGRFRQMLQQPVQAGAGSMLQKLQKSYAQIAAITDTVLRNVAVKEMLGAEADRYSVALLDISDPDNPVYAEHNASIKNNVGSVGKMLVGLTVFQLLHDFYPDDIAARENMLRHSQVVADEFIRRPSHKVVFWQPDTRARHFRLLKEGDTASLWEYLDRMYSASSNAAAAMVMKHIILLQHNGVDYPVPQQVSGVFFASTSFSELGKTLDKAMSRALISNGLNPALIRQGSFFTRQGKRRVAGKTSYATAQELLYLLYKLESGQLVDEWSSREMKRLLYMTQKRIRYASHPVLKDAAEYF